MNVMMLAAGEGIRLRPYTQIRPKPAIPFLSIPLAAYPLAFLEDMKIDRLVVNTFHLPTKIVDLFIHMNHKARRLHFSHEINQILDTGGGLGAARDYFKSTDDLILMNSDEVILPIEKGILANALEQHKKNNAFCTLLTMDYEGVGTKFGGVWLDHQEQVRGFGKTAPGMECIRAEHFIGVQILSGKIFDYLPNGYPANILYDTVTKAISEGQRVQRFKVNCHWYETGNPQDFMTATKHCLDILTQKTESYEQSHLRRAIERFSQQAPILQSTKELTLLKSPDAVLEKDVELTGYAVLGAGCRIGAASKLKNVVVADKVRLAPQTEAQDLLFLENT